MVRNGKSQNRIYFLDELRGLAVFCMVFYHAFYILDSMFAFEPAAKLFEFFMPVQPMFAGIFISVCGVSCSLSKSNLRRGLRLLAVAAGFTLVTAVIMPMLGFVECEVYFGILHFLSVCIIIYALIENKLSAALPVGGILACAVLYPFFSGISEGFLNYGNLFWIKIPDVLYTTNLLVPLGIYKTDFFSADYFPLLPNIFIFFAGVFAGRYFKSVSFPEWMHKSRAAFLAFLGRNALVIYIAHMPVIYILAFAADYVVKMFI